MASNRIMFLVLWIILTICTMFAFRFSKKEVRSVSWQLRLSFSAFTSLFMATIVLSAIYDIGP